MANSDDKLFVCVSGVTSSDADQDIIDSLKKYGPVAGIRRVQNTGGSDGETVVVEFQSGTTRANVEPLLPMEVANVTNPSVKWKVDHVPTLTSSADQAAAVPSASSTDSSSDSDNGARSDNSTTPLVRKSKKRSKHGKPLPPFTPTTTHNPSASSTVTKKYHVHTNPTSPTLSNEVTNPPEIQRVVVEHVIKSQPSNSKWMRTFSGKIPKPPGEADYETWSLHAE